MQRLSDAPPSPLFQLSCHKTMQLTSEQLQNNETTDCYGWSDSIWLAHSTPRFVFPGYKSVSGNSDIHFRWSYSQVRYVNWVDLIATLRLGCIQIFLCVERVGTWPTGLIVIILTNVEAGRNMLYVVPLIRLNNIRVACLVSAFAVIGM